MKYFSSLHRICIIIIVSLVACHNNGVTIRKVVDQEIDSSVALIKGEVEKSKADFFSAYSDFSRNHQKIVDEKAIEAMRDLLVDGEVYLDSLQTQLEPLDKNDVENVTKIKDIFVNGSVGDSIFFKLNRSVSAAMTAASSQRSKIIIDSLNHSIINEPDIFRWKNQLFGLTNPLGASLILYGFQNQLYENGLVSLNRGI